LRESPLAGAAGAVPQGGRSARGPDPGPTPCRWPPRVCGTPSPAPKGRVPRPGVHGRLRAIAQRALRASCALGAPDLPLLTRRASQAIDPHTHQYMQRLQDELALLALAQKASDYLEGIGDARKQARVALRRVEHFYYKSDAIYAAMRKLMALQLAASAEEAAAALEAADADEGGDLGEDSPEVRAASAAALLRRACAEQGALRRRRRHPHGQSKAPVPAGVWRHKPLVGRELVGKVFFLGGGGAGCYESRCRRA
jgi:Eukaryotic translation initiation factor 3 subunit 8 N-terminus